MEIEGKILEVDAESVRAKLQNLSPDLFSRRPNLYTLLLIILVYR